MNSKQILKAIQAKREEARGKMDSNDMAGARAIAEEIRGLEADLETALEIEEGEMRDLQKAGKRLPAGGDDENRAVTREDELRAVGKYLLGMNMTDEERGLVTVADNGGLLPQGYINDLQVLREGYPSLKKYTHVVPVTTKTGKMPVATLGNNKLAKLSSNKPIPEGSVSTGEILYDIEDYGKFVAIENSLTDDEVVGIVESILLPDFAEGSVESENEEILAHIKSNAKVVTGDDYTIIEKAMDELVPACRAGVITITNTAGFTYLKNKKDAIGRNLNLITKLGNEYIFNGKPIVELSDEVITPSSEGKLVFYTVNLKEAVKFFERKGIIITKSKEFLFNKNQDCLRAIERFDTSEGNMRSCRKVEFTPASATPTALTVDEVAEINLGKEEA